MRTESTSIKKLDSAMILILIALFLLSIVFIYSSQQIGQYGAHNFAMKQGINYIVGFLLLFLVAKLDIDQIEQLAWPVYITLFLSIILLRFSPGLNRASNSWGQKMVYNPVIGFYPAIRIL